MLNFEEIRSKIATVRVPQRKTYKMAAMTLLIWKFQNPRKKDLTNTCQIICRKFHQNPSIRLGCSAVTHTHTDTQTHTHTHTHTHTLDSIATYSVKFAEYKKQKTKATESERKKKNRAKYIYKLHVRLILSSG